MKNSVKLGLAALALSVSLASCFGDDKPKEPIDSTTTKVAIDTNTAVKIDTAGKVDTLVKKTTKTTKTTEIKKN